MVPAIVDVLSRKSDALPVCATATIWWPSVIVQAVDPDYLPIIGATVTVTALGGKKQSLSARTEDGGFAKLFFPVDDNRYSPTPGYSIEVKMPNFKTARLKQLYIRKPSESLYVPSVQLVIQISEHDSVTVY